MTQCPWSCCLLRPGWSPGLHCGCCTEAKGSVSVSVCVLGEGVRLGGGGRFGPLWALGIASHSPQHEKHGCLSGSFPSASWFTSILLRACPCQEQQGFGQAPSVISDGTKFSFTCSAGRHRAGAGCYIKGWLCRCHCCSCFLVQRLALWQFTAYLLVWYCLADALWWLHPQKKTLGLICSLSVFNSQSKYQKAMYKTVSLLLPKEVHTPLCFSYEYWFSYSIRIFSYISCSWSHTSSLLA